MNKLNIEYKKLVEIAKALNENTIANKTRSKGNKITTDKFIRKFRTDRKKFSASIKDTGISYNTSTHLYDIKDASGLNSSIVNENKDNIIKAKLQDKENSAKEITKGKENKSTEKDSTSLVSEDTRKKFEFIISEVNTLEKIIKWYKTQNEKDNKKLDNIIYIDELSGEVAVTTIRLDKNIWNEFKKFMKQHKQYKSMDMISMAFKEYMEKHN